MRLSYISVLIGTMLFLIGLGLPQTVSAKTLAEGTGEGWATQCFEGKKAGKVKGKLSKCCTDKGEKCEGTCKGDKGDGEPDCRAFCHAAEAACLGLVSKYWDQPYDIMKALPTLISP